MPNETWFEINSGGEHYATAEQIRPIAARRARETDDVVEIYRVSRVLVKTVQRSVTVAEADVP